ncbi:MAG TPA: hypothetical protein VKY74_10570, partial [Chloroflexia bacterium]|nr:hypothetical protein [Chloroflexia bacterium]
VLRVLVLLPVLVGCQMPGGAAPALPTPTPLPTAAPTDTLAPATDTPAPTTISLDDLKNDLQNVVDLERRAEEANSKDEYLSQIDSGDRDWYHLQQDEFTDNSYLIGRLKCVANVRYDAEHQTAVADVGIDDCPGRYHVGMFFRLVGNRWLHSQPALNEQGLRNTKKIGPFRVTYHEMDAGYLSVLEQFAPAVYDRVSTVMDTKQLDVDVDLISRPTDMPRSAFTTIALYNPAIARMSMLSPFFWPSGDGTEVELDDQIRVTLTHEFTHHAVRTLATTLVPHWINEGMAVYVSQENPTRYVRDIQQLAIVNRLAPPDALDGLLLDGTTAELGYAEGYSFVSYLTAQEGDAVLPKILRDIHQIQSEDRTRGLDQALQDVTGKGLDAWWAAWRQSVSS